MRYVGQGHEIGVELPAAVVQGRENAATDLREAFDRGYEAVYGRTIPGLDVEVLSWTLVISAPAQTSAPTGPLTGSATPAALSPNNSHPEPSHRADLFAGGVDGHVSAAVHQRPDLDEGSAVPGPALIAETQTTTVVPDGWEARVLKGGHLLVDRNGHDAGGGRAGQGEGRVRRTAGSDHVEPPPLGGGGAGQDPGAHRVFDPGARGGRPLGRRLRPEGAHAGSGGHGTPGHVNAMAASVGCFLRDHPVDTLREGDVLVTNDPWEGTGHLNDFTVVTPAFLHGRLVALFAATSHIADVGGRGFGADANQVFEEGIRIPIGYLIRAGEVDDTLMRMVRANVREPDVAQGDLYSLAACNETGCERLAAMMTEFGLESLDDLAGKIITASRRAMLERIRALRPGTYRHRMTIDGYDQDLEFVCTLAVSDDGITIDFDGTSPQSPYGINVPETYTRAYASFGVRCVVGSEVPNNAGSLSAIEVTAPVGCLLNAPPPAAVSARHSIGQMLPDVVLGALGQAMPPGSVPAEGASCLWNPVIMGGQGLAGS